METFQRIIVTLIFLPILYIGLENNFYRALYFSLGVILIGFLGYFELRNLLNRIGWKHTFLVPLGLALTYGSFFYGDFGIFKGALGVLFVLECAYWIILEPEFPKALNNILSGIFVLFYLGIFWGSAILLRQWNGGQIFPQSGFVLGAYHFVILLVGTWVCDIGAYFGGRWFGRTKLELSISPNKTLEGFICGVLLSWVCLLLTVWALGFHMHLTILFLPFVAVVGDLFESLMKRAAKTKDSSHWIPGHGGILDIFDALIFTAPIYYFFILPWY